MGVVASEPMRVGFLRHRPRRRGYDSVNDGRVGEARRTDDGAVPLRSSEPLRFLRAAEHRLAFSVVFF
jgi:hypothetical protein